MALRAWTVATIGACALVACAAFGDGAAPAVAPPPTDDGGSSTSSSSSGGATSTSSSGSSGLTDAAADALGAPRFCATVSASRTDCVDFDDDVVPYTGFWQRYEMPVGAINLLNCGPGTSKRCIELKGNRPLGSGNAVGAALYRTVGGAPRSVKVSTAVRIGSISGGTWDALGIRLSSGQGNGTAIELELDGAGKVYLTTFVIENGVWSVNDSVLAAATLKIGDWYTFELALSVSNDESTVQLWVDGVADVELPTTAYAMTTLDSFAFGDPDVDQGVSFSMRLDELTTVIP